MGHKSILAESAYPDSGLEFSKCMNGKISRAEIICFLPGFLCKFAGIFFRESILCGCMIRCFIRIILRMRGLKRKSVSDQLKTKAVRKANGNVCLFSA